MEAGNVVRDDWNGYNVLHDTASRVAALDIGFLPSASATEVLLIIYNVFTASGPGNFSSFETATISCCCYCLR